jgi:hypothetical protein
MSPVNATGVQGALQIKMMKAAQQSQLVGVQAVSDALAGAKAMQAQAAARPGTGSVVDLRV